MNGSILPTTITAAALAAALIATGCCGPKRDRTASYYSPSSTTSQYSSTAGTENTPSQATAQTTTTATTTQPERTNVRETVATAGQNDWTLPLYAESLRVGKREVENGNVRLRKVIHTEQASQPIDLRRETVVVDREAFDQARQAAAAGQPNDLGVAFQEKEITIDLKREEPVVEVQPYVAGRIVAQKRTTTEHQNVDRQVRREDVEVIKNGNDRDITISERVRNTRNEATGAPASGQNRQSGSIRSNTQGAQGQLQNEDESEPPRKQQ